MTEETFRWVITAGVSMTAICMFVAAIVALTVASGLRKLQVRVQAIIDRAEPILDTARRVLEDTAPKFATVTTDAAEVVRLSREQTERLSELIRDFSERAKVQVARIDGTIDHSLEQFEIATEAVKGAVLKPVREFNGIFSGIKTAVTVYATGRRASVDHATQDEEMFI
jgi:uncharacterized protein YoxC